MDQNIKLEINNFTRAGFWEVSDLVQIFCEEKYEPGELDSQEVRSIIGEEIKQIRQESLNWPKETDCDRLDKIFKVLNDSRILSLQNAGYTQSDGYDDVRNAYDKLDKDEEIIGYCFYHGQDLQRVVGGDDLFLAFGPMNSDQEDTIGVKVGNLIVDTFNKYGLQAKWNGTFNERIRISGIKWLKRI